MSHSGLLCSPPQMPAVDVVRGAVLHMGWLGDHPLLLMGLLLLSGDDVQAIDFHSLCVHDVFSVPWPKSRLLELYSENIWELWQSILLNGVSSKNVVKRRDKISLFLRTAVLSFQQSLATL